ARRKAGERRGYRRYRHIRGSGNGRAAVDVRRGVAGREPAERYVVVHRHRNGVDRDQGRPEAGCVDHGYLVRTAEYCREVDQRGRGRKGNRACGHEKCCDTVAKLHSNYPPALLPPIESSASKIRTRIKIRNGVSRL